MNEWEILLVSLGLSLDVCAAMICKGAVIARWEKPKIFCVAILFTLWQVLALLAGSLIRLLPWVSRKTFRIQQILSLIHIWKSSRPEGKFPRRKNISWDRISGMKSMRSAIIRCDRQGGQDGRER